MLRFLRQWITDTLGFTKSEANGILILAVLIVAIAVLPRIYLHNTKYTPEGFNGGDPDLKKLGDELSASIIRKEASEEEESTEAVAVRAYPFDPNTVSKDQLIELGFSEQVSHNLVNYRRSGGSFYIKDDLRKIYGIPEDRVDQLWDYIMLPEVRPQQKTTAIPVANIEKEKEEKLRIELNTTDESALQQISGIGVKLSARIIKYRDLLGGFHTLDQLDEVYGLKPEVIEVLKNASVINTPIKPINLNADSASQLYKHPYIDYNIAYAIVNYRTQHGDFDSVAQLRDIKIISDSLYQKIYLYLSLNQ